MRNKMGYTFKEEQSVNLGNNRFGVGQYYEHVSVEVGDGRVERTDVFKGYYCSINDKLYLELPSLKIIAKKRY